MIREVTILTQRVFSQLAGKDFISLLGSWKVKTYPRTFNVIAAASAKIVSVIK